MDAIAFLMFAEPAVTPSPRSETPLADAPFGSFVASAVNSEEQDAHESTDARSDMAAPQAGFMAAIVSQWLAQRDSAPSSPSFAREILEERSSVAAEVPSSPDTAEEPALPIENPLPTNAEEQTSEAADRTSGHAKTLRAKTDHDQIVSENAAPDEGSAPVAPRAQTEESRVPLQQLVQHAADIGWSVPNSETRLASKELKTSPRSEQVVDTVANLQAPTPDTRASTTLSSQAVEPPADRPVKAAVTSEAPLRDDVNESSAVQPKATAAADRPNVPEQASTAHASTRTLESLQPPPTTPSNVANTPSPAADNISIPPPPSNISAAESSANIPVKLAAVTREGQTAEMQTLALHIAARWAKGESRFTIRLDPPELGRIDVNLNVNSHGHAQAALAVEKPQTLDLLLRDAPTLERALKDAGLEMGGNLSFSLKDDARQNFAHGDQYSPPSRTLELVPAEAAKPHVALSASLVEQLYGSRTARLDITV